MPIYQMNYPRQQEALREEARAQAWLEALAAQGYYLTQRTEGLYSHWLQGVSTGTLALSAGLSAQAQEPLRAFCAGERDQLACEAFALSGEITMDVDLWYSRGVVLLSVDDRYFSRKAGQSIG